ncbi:hypothetical protein ABZ093_34005 [Streptomyces cyaneofuscatus]|uniref:hypothetical protein n=1 Tax=Streptomyces cyaneofuscatus TaxID=66883 RepID=UPI0033AC3C38
MLFAEGRPVQPAIALDGRFEQQDGPAVGVPQQLHGPIDGARIGPGASVTTDDE